MKIALECQSILLKKALNIFLKPSIVSKKHCDFVICDYEGKFECPVFFINTASAHIKKPFSKDELLEKIEEFYILTCKHDNKQKDDNLELEIESLAKDFSTKLVNIIRKHYEG